MKLMTAICVLALALGASAQVGPSGIVDPQGNNKQFSHEFAMSNLLIGPSGIVSDKGPNVQLTAGQAQLHNNLPGAPSHTPEGSLGNVGAAGYFKRDGTPVQLTHEQAMNVLQVGPSAILFRNGESIQLRKKRSFSNLPVGTLIGSSGLTSPEGHQRQFTPEEAASILLVGNTGLITKTGNYQFSARHKRAVGDLVGSGGALLQDARHQVQFKEAGVYLVAEGESGYIFSDGTLVQKHHIV